MTLTLFSTVMGLVLNAFFQFNSQNKRLESLVALRQEARVLERLVRDDLNAVVLLNEFIKPMPNDVAPRKSGIIGQDDRFGEWERDRIHMHVKRRSRFYRYLSFNEDPEIHEVSYYIDDDNGETPQFKRREQYYIDSDMTEGDESIIHTLSEHVVSFDVKYYSVGSPQELDEWDSSARQTDGAALRGLPVGVRVFLRLEDPSGEIYEKTFQVNFRPIMGTGYKWN